MKKTTIAIVIAALATILAITAFAKNSPKPEENTSPEITAWYLVDADAYLIKVDSDEDGTLDSWRMFDCWDGEDYVNEMYGDSEEDFYKANILGATYMANIVSMFPEMTFVVE